MHTGESLSHTYMVFKFNTVLINISNIKIRIVKKHVLFSLRDLRLRKLLGTRYDSRTNAFDWDYNMRLVERGVSVQCYNPARLHVYAKLSNGDKFLELVNHFFC